jgi:hypothetical protein
MGFMHLIIFYNFLQILNNTGKHSTKNEYFPTPILFATIYLLQEEILNPINYSKQKIIMSNFVQATEPEVYMYAKFEYFTLYAFVQLTTPSFDLLQFYTMQ